MTRSRVVWVHAMGAGHVTRRDAERVRDETSGIGPGSSGCRDGVGTGRGTSHNSCIALVTDFRLTPGHLRGTGQLTSRRHLRAGRWGYVLFLNGRQPFLCLPQFLARRLEVAPRHPILPGSHPTYDGLRELLLPADSASCHYRHRSHIHLFLCSCLSR